MLAIRLLMAFRAFAGIATLFISLLMKKTLNSISTQRYSSIKWHHGNKEKARVHKLVKKALESGVLISEPCEICGLLKVEAHHEDYSKPLDVTWLCRTHHRERHMEINQYYLNNPQLVLI